MRLCKRCGVPQDKKQFAPEGYVCFTCHRSAADKRDQRKRKGGKVGRPKKYATAEEARKAKIAKTNEAARRRASTL